MGKDCRRTRINYEHVTGGDLKMTMLRNIDVLKEIKDQIVHFDIDCEKLVMMLEMEGMELDEAIDDECQEYVDVLKDIRDIGASLAKLTEDLRDAIEEDCFDFSSFQWCLDKVEDEEFELVNYMESFENALEALEPILDRILRGNKILNQYAYTDGEKIENKQGGTE